MAMGKRNVFFQVAFVWSWEREMHSSKQDPYMTVGKRNVFIQVGPLCGHGKEKCIHPSRGFVWSREREIYLSK
jgi:hypothetical protein